MKIIRIIVGISLILMSLTTFIGGRFDLITPIILINTLLGLASGVLILRKNKIGPMLFIAIILIGIFRSSGASITFQLPKLLIIAFALWLTVNIKK